MSTVLTVIGGWIGIIIVIIFLYNQYQKYKDEQYEKEREREKLERIMDEKKSFERSLNYNRNELKILVDGILGLFNQSNNNLELIENDFDKLLKKYENQISEIDKTEGKNYTHHFVKISKFIQNQKKSIESLYSEIRNIKEIQCVESYTNLNTISNNVTRLGYGCNKEHIEKMILLYEQTILHSINMIVSLLKNKKIIFYQIYEEFDELGIFDSKWQNKVYHKLEEINENILLLNSSIVNGLSNLSYVFENSMKELEENITYELKEIHSNISFNNLLTAIQTRKLYQIRSDTKRLN